MNNINIVNSDQEWFCLDDGTGRNVYYVNSQSGARSRNIPENFVQECLSSGHVRYYFRGKCIRCRKVFAPCVISKNNWTVLFSLNICDECIITTTPSIDKIRNNGDIIWMEHLDTPKLMYVNTEEYTLSPNRVDILIERSKIAKYYCQFSSKLRRNAQRLGTVRALALAYNVREGKLVSWGFESLYDEYYGQVNEAGEPHGFGVKFYSDKSTYVGNFQNGKRHCNGGGSWSRSNNLLYEGSWMTDFKHGKGVQTYPDGSRYEGEFAKGWEHGKGRLSYTNGDVFEGRFRFGKRDGPGVLVKNNGKIEKKNFRDLVPHFDDKAPLVIRESPEPELELDVFQPDSLIDIAIRAVTKAMQFKRHCAPAALLQNRLCSHLKPLVASYFLETRYPKGSDKFIQASSHYAFQNISCISICNTRITIPDVESLLYFQSANSQLESLHLNAARLEPISIDLICKQILTQCWPLLKEINLSFNSFESATIQLLMDGISGMSTLSDLRLSSCNIRPNSAHIIAQQLQQDQQIKLLDLSFNAVSVLGAESLARALRSNTCLTSLNLRRNDIGSLGGEYFVEAMKNNHSIRVLNLADNNCGTEVISEIAGRLRGSIYDVMNSTLVFELQMPSQYREDRFTKKKSTKKM